MQITNIKFADKMAISTRKDTINGEFLMQN